MHKALFALALTTSLAVLPLGGGVVAVADPAPAGTHADDADHAATAAIDALDALDEAKALFDRPAPTPERRLSGNGPAPTRDGTLALRELALRIGDLSSRADRLAAHRILQRPTDGGASGTGEPKYSVPASEVCTARVCVHWVENDLNAPTGSDGEPATVPSWVSTTLSTVDRVYRAETGALGYRNPASDLVATDNGGDARLDVYLADIGGQGLFGYCAPEGPAGSSAYAAYGYCVLDNDYASRQFGTAHSPLQNLQVTAAHEIFHAVQFGYDWTEDLWLMEGTAAWMEDELYDAVNDNRGYLSFSPLAASDMPLDFVTEQTRGYGAWIFWRFLSEWTGRGAADDPSVVRQVWQAAAGARYSTAALKRVLAARHTSFPVALARFGMWNRDPSRFYSEGRAYHAPPLLARKTFTRSSRSTARRSVRQYHMGQRFVRYTPGRSLRGRWRLRASVDLADTFRGSRAQLVVHRRSGAVVPVTVPLTRHGVGVRVVRFDRRTVRYVELGLIDASTRFRCGRDTYLSCAGLPLDDGVRSTFSARVLR